MPRVILKARGTIRNDPERQNGENSRENGESQNGENSRENGENYSFLTNESTAERTKNNENLRSSKYGR
jgi:hypothetical protein